MSYIGSWKIDDLVTFVVNTHDPQQAGRPAVDADGNPTYRVYEDETGTPILTGTMAKLDDANTVGFYSEQITLSAANGFEKGKSYNIYISATVDSVTGTTHRTLQIEAEVDANVVSGGVNVTTIEGSDPTDQIRDAVVDDATRIDASALNTAAATTIPTNLNATVSSRASQSSVDDVPTNAELATAIASALTTAVADSIPSMGNRPSIAQGIYMLVQWILERQVSGTTMTINKPDGSTALLTVTLDDDTNPTAYTRAT